MDQYRSRLKLSENFERHFDTEYDRAKVPPYNGNNPPPAPRSLKALLFPPLLNNVENKGTQGVRARYAGTSSIHSHCPVPRSSSHIGHGLLADSAADCFVKLGSGE